MSRRRRRALPKAFTLDAEVVVNNTLSDALTVVEVSGLDRPGLLYELTSALSDLGLDINSAHITTYGEKAVDVFYVTDLAQRKVSGDAREAEIRTRLAAVLSGGADAGG
ncbi:MAG: ACT domain-containing protein [Hyphomicrobiaceae bacterium]